MHSTRPAWTSASRSIPARIYTTAPASRCSCRASGNHPRCKILYDPSHFVLQQLDYLGFIDLYHERIGAFHVKDAEFNPTARQGVYGGYQSWVDRAGRFRSLGDGQVNFSRHLLEAGAIRICRLGGAGMGMRHQVGGTGRARRCAVHPRAPDPGDGQGVRRLRRGHHGRCGQPPHAGSGLRIMAATRLACVSAWSAADRARSSARCTASPRGSTMLCPGLRRAVVRSGPCACFRRGDRSRSGPELWLLHRDVRRGTHALRRDGGGGDRDAEPPALPRRACGVARRVPRDLRQAAGDQRGGSGCTGAIGRRCRSHLCRHLQLFRLSDGASGSRHGRARRHRRTSRRAGRIRPGLASGTAGGHRTEAGGMANRSVADPDPAVPSATSAAMRSIWPASSAAAFPSRSSPIYRRSLRDERSTTTHTCCSASPVARAACCGRARWRTAMRTRCGSACMARTAGWNGRRRNRIVSGSRHRSSHGRC